jgi:integrating conjugative element protein (TIGR03749 family)
MAPIVAVALVSFFGTIPTQVFANDLDVSSYEKLFWRGRPINIHLQTGVQHLIRFPSPVQIGMTPDLSSNVSVESAANVVYLTAKADFDAVRIRFRRLDTGTIYLFNIRSSKKGSSSLTELVDAQTSNDEVSDVAEGSPNKPGKTPYGYVTLTRFAFQKVYAPDRLIEDLKGVSERTLKSKQPIRHLIPGSEVAAVPWAQWTTPNGLYVTAVYLSNMANQSVQLDPRNFRHSKEWLSTSLFAGHLAPHDALGDSTTMVVISEAPWEDSIAWLR